MAIVLTKGQKLDMGLARIKVGLGWDPNPAMSHQAFDLDVSLFLLNAQRQIPTEQHLVFYNNPVSPDQAVCHTGDDRSGGNSDGDDEVITLDLAQVSPDIQEILFVATIHDAVARRQNFGQVRNAYIRICDQANQDAELAKYELDEDFSVESAVEFGRLYKRNGQWRFEASGIGYRQDLSYFVGLYAAHLEVQN
jgi:tellurium resistance protein TerD